MTFRRSPVRVRVALAALAVVFASGCSALLPKPHSPPALYAFGEMPADRADGSTAPLPSGRPGLILIVEPPHADPGFDSARIVYTRAAGSVAYFAHSEWIDTPARMLAPLLATTLAAGSGFRAVVAAPSSAAGDVRLETRIIRLQQDFAQAPSRVRFTLRAELILEGSRDVASAREFDAIVMADSADPAGGVRAARLAVAQVLRQVRAFCAETAAMIPPLAEAR
jgi:cholesterol transport system auxiliary component